MPAAIELEEWQEVLLAGAPKEWTVDQMAVFRRAFNGRECRPVPTRPRVGNPK